jgi:hypothetical protein
VKQKVIVWIDTIKKDMDGSEERRRRRRRRII